MTDKPFSIEKFRVAWGSDATVREIGVAFNVTGRTVGERAKALGLPSRRNRPRRKRIPAKTMALMLDMRAFGLTLAAISQAVGLSKSVVQRQFEWRDLPRYPRVRIAPTLADYHEHVFASAMAASAAQTRRVEEMMANVDSKMFPRIRTGVKARAAAERRAA